MKTAQALIAKLKQAQRLKRDFEELRVRSRRARPISGEGILDFQVRVSPNLRRATHFESYAAKLEQGVGGGLRVVFAAPPQHGKTSLTLHGLAWLIIKHPDKRHAYITYSQTRARSVARAVRRILERAGVEVGGTLGMMTFGEGGQCLFTSIEGGITGEPVDGVAIIDDPFKNRKEADSERRREVVEESYTDAIETRVHEGGSIFLLATRWHPRDLSGTRIAEGWESINLPALAEENDPNGREVGEPLFPELWSLQALEFKRRKVGEFTWAALYQGRPRPKGGTVFHEPTYYSSLPKVYRGAYGVDLAYSAKTSADWSICVELWREEPPLQGMLERYYVIRVDRARVEAPQFKKTLIERLGIRKWPMLWRASGTEKGVASFLRPEVPLQVKQPPGDKLVSALDVAAAWNDGRVLVPDRDAFKDHEMFEDIEDWIDKFLDTVGNFTGTGKEKDDDVDGLGNAHDLLKGPPRGHKRPEVKRVPSAGELTGGF